MNLTHITNPRSGSHETAARLISQHGKANAMAHCEKHRVGAMTALEESYWGNMQALIQQEMKDG
jgi:hypothetical protein